MSAVGSNPEEPVAPPQGAANESEIRALLRILSSQSENANPIVAIAALVLIFTLYSRVDHQGLLIWATLACTLAIWRHLLSRRIRHRTPTADEPELRRFEQLMLIGTAVSSVVMGSAFWLVALHGDLYARMIVTLISMVHMVAVLLYLTPSTADRLIRTGGNIGQGMLFWLGIGTAEAPRWEILVVYCGLFWCGLVFGREQLRQFHESLRMRNENAKLLAQLEQDRQVIQDALLEARHANESKSRFLAAASHDLRQPLHAMTMFLGTLGFHVAGDAATRLLERVKDTARMLEEQFNSLLDMSRFDVGAVRADIRPFRLDLVASKLVEEFRPVAEARGLQLTLEVVPALAHSDPVLLGRLLRNLIDNAIKYTVSGTVTMRVEPLAQGFGVEVADTGPGIAPEQLQRIFEEYVQLANPARQRSHGVGLGLAIVKRIDQLLGLRLALHSMPGLGSRFCIQVPAAASDATESSSRLSPLASTAFRTDAVIWVLDDDPMILESLQAQLEAWGAKVRTFADAEDLLAAARLPSPSPTWILTDDMLGGRYSGLALAQVLMQECTLQKICVITGNTDPDRLAELRASGLPVIVKPASPEQLIAVLAPPPSVASA